MFTSCVYLNECIAGVFTLVGCRCVGMHKRNAHRERQRETVDYFSFIINKAFRNKAKKKTNNENPKTQYLYPNFGCVIVMLLHFKNQSLLFSFFFDPYFYGFGIERAFSKWCFHTNKMHCALFAFCQIKMISNVNKFCCRLNACVHTNN